MDVSMLTRCLLSDVLGAHVIVAARVQQDQLLSIEVLKTRHEPTVCETFITHFAARSTAATDAAILEFSASETVASLSLTAAVLRLF